MAGQTDICNLTLTLLGEPSIVSIDDDSNAARTLKAIYDLERLSELRAHNWTFSLFDKQVASVAQTPVPPYTYSYRLPSDCLKVITVGGIRQQLDSINYRTGLEKLYILRGKMLYTNMAGPQWFNYVQDVTDTTMFDPCFNQSLAARMAWTACERITGSTAKRAKCQSEYDDKMVDALINNAVEQLPDGIADGAWTTSRL